MTENKKIVSKQINMGAPKPIRNDELKAAMEAMRVSPGDEATVQLLNAIVTANMLIPIFMDKQPEYDEKTGEFMLEEKTLISFEIITNKAGEMYYPVFTDGEEMKKCDIDKDQQSMIVNFADLAAILCQPQNKVSGFVVNPMNENLIFPVEMIEAMKRDMMKEDTANADNDKKENSN